jgi:hypothetical protein
MEHPRREAGSDGGEEPPNRGVGLVAGPRLNLE